MDVCRRMRLRPPGRRHDAKFEGGLGVCRHCATVTSASFERHFAKMPKVHSARDNRHRKVDDDSFGRQLASAGVGG